MTRKKKLMEKQKAGKSERRPGNAPAERFSRERAEPVRQFGKVEIPQQAFINALKIDS